MRAEYFVMLYDYNAWANERILDAAEGLSTVQLGEATPYSAGGLRGTLVHTLSAEWLWRSRWQGVSPTAMFRDEDFPTLEAIRTRWRIEDQQLRAYVAGLTDADVMAVVSYTTMRGEPDGGPLWHLLAHVANHSTQHRSEAAAILTTLGRSPGPLDLIIFLDDYPGASQHPSRL